MTTCRHDVTGFGDSDEDEIIALVSYMCDTDSDSEPTTPSARPRMITPRAPIIQKGELDATLLPRLPPFSSEVSVEIQNLHFVASVVENGMISDDTTAAVQLGRHLGEFTEYLEARFVNSEMVIIEIARLMKSVEAAGEDVNVDSLLISCHKSGIFVNIGHLLAGARNPHRLVEALRWLTIWQIVIFHKKKDDTAVELLLHIKSKVLPSIQRVTSDSCK